MGDTGGLTRSELSTVSTPATVETTEETTGGVITPRQDLAGEKGGCGGEKGAAAVDAPWARALASIEACRRGVCAYRNPEAPRDGRAAAAGCDGYHASRGLDEYGRPLIRWSLCPRHRVWWGAERRRRAARRAEP